MSTTQLWIVGTFSAVSLSFSAWQLASLFEGFFRKLTPEDIAAWEWARASQKEREEGQKKRWAGLVQGRDKKG